jgi:DNA polymerase
VAEDPRRALAIIARRLSEHLAWLSRGGVLAVPPAPPRTPSRKPSLSPSPSPPPPSTGGAARLQLVREEMGDCQRCKLAKGRQHLVFGTGNPDASLVFVGEAPGAEEDRTGEPFVGAAGQLLTKMIEAMGLSREHVYICNIIKSRPPGNRNPEPDEIAACEPFLKKQLAAIRPRMIVCLGKFAAQTLLRSDAPISKLRGQWKAYEGIPLMPTFHPAFLLRNPAAKREVWADLQLVMGELDRLGIARPRRK